MLSHAQPIAPMEAKLTAMLPDGEGWQYEPKWDGFRAIAVRAGDNVALWSKSGKPLARYFPELTAAIAATSIDRFILDGEIILPVGEVLSFDALQARLHPAASRIARLSKETPAQLMLFDVLAADGENLAAEPLSVRRAALEKLFPAIADPSFRLSPATMDIAEAKAWLDRSGGALDGVVAKRRDEPYRSGERAMLKVKQLRTADCVIGGLRMTDDGAGVASLLLGLYDDAGKLHHVGFTSAIAAADRIGLLKKLMPAIGGPGFTGKAPGGPSRWNPKGDTSWISLQPKWVVEVIYDQVTGNRFRHGTRLHRWRSDKAPEQCTLDQLQHELRPAELGSVIGRQ